MSMELWIAFALASSVLLAVPGPTVMVVVSYALGTGRSSAWATVPGVTLGDFTAMTLSLLGSAPARSSPLRPACSPPSSWSGRAT
jgi:threonine/homoserine/homoserine lactone efflux protein